MKKNKRFRYYYLLLLLFPIAFVFLYKPDIPSLPDSKQFQFFTSIKSDSKINLQLTNNNIQLQSWQGPFNHYKQIGGSGEIDNSGNTNIKLKIERTKSGDTIRFLSLNFWMDKHLYTLPVEKFKTLKTSSNIKILEDDDQFKILILSTSKESWIQFNDIVQWQTDNISTYKFMFISVVFLIFILLILFIKAERNWFFASFFVSFISMIFYWWIGLDVSAQLTIDHFPNNKTAVFYFNSIPLFDENLKIIYNDISSPLRKMQVNPSNQSFYRIDFEDDKQNLENINIKYSAGIIKKTWELNNIKPCQLIANDVDFVNNSYILSGEDPYISITSASFVNDISKVLYLRSNIYIVFTLITFICLLLVEDKFSKYLAASLMPFFFFYSIILSAFWFLFVNAERLILEDEKRLATIYPQINIVGYKEYFKQLSPYLKDQFPGKSRLTTLNNLFRYRSFGDVANNNIVHFGKKGWMFYIGENVKDVYENKNLLTNEELERMKKVLEDRKEYLESLGIKYYVVFPRMSHYFYQEFVGVTLHQYNKKAKLEQFLEYMKAYSKVNIIDIYSDMKLAKDTSKRDLYYHEDSHWNLYGTYFAYQAIINTIRKDFPNIPKPIPINEIKWIETQNEEGDLPKLLSLSKYIKRHEYIPMNDRINCAYSIPPPDYPEYQSMHKMIFYQGKDSTLPKLIMNRDSYSNYLISYFGSHFSRQGYLWSPIFFPGIMKTEKPDIVITEMMERFLSDLLVTNPPIPKIEKQEEEKNN